MANIPAYSPRKNIVKRMPEYSVRYPITSSDSAIGMSKGVRFSSARAAVMKIPKPMI